MISSRIGKALSAAALVGLAAWFLPSGPSSAETARAVPAPAADEVPAQATPEIAIFAGGCFWGVQGVFQHVDGVISAVSGYAGGDPATADYHRVSGGRTGHAESVQVTFDPRKVTYGQLLRIFFSVAHDPTQLNRQGPDVGTQYRSALFPVTEAQKKVAVDYIAQIDRAHVFSSAVATAIEPGRAFYPAEAYHQNYLTLHPDSPYIAIHDLPKVRALKQMFSDVYRDDPVLAANAR